MLVIKEHIKSGDFKPFYLLHGEETYLKKLYRDKLKQAIIDSEDTMNYSYYEGKDFDQKDMVSIAQTMPFFADRRLIIVEHSGLFKNQSDLVEQLAKAAESTIVIFVETEVDKRNRLYKFFKDKGCIAEMNGLDEKNLKLFVASLLGQEGKKITTQTLDYLLDRTGSDMLHLQNEVKKLSSYADGRDVITIADIDAVVTVQITGKMFQMIDAIGLKQLENALNMYYDLVALKEKPLSILYLMIRHFNILLQIKDLSRRGIASNQMAEKVGVPSFAVNKYLAQTKNFTSSKLKEYLEYGTELEESVKTGRMAEHIAVEMSIIKFSGQ